MQNNPQNQRNLTEFEIPAGLFEKVMRRIELEKKAQILRRYFIFTSVSFVAALILIFPAWRAFRSNIAQTGFNQYISLLFLDSKTVLANWQDYSLTLLESLPIINAILLLAAIFAILFTLKLIAKFGISLKAVSKLRVN